VRCESPPEKARRARGILRLLSDSRLIPNAYVIALRGEFERVAIQQDELFFHDDLNEINQPFYFHEFISAAHQHQLQFLGEAGSEDLRGENLTPEMASLLVELEKEKELIREQYRDFALGRAFRRTLLCRTEVPLSRDFLHSQVSTLYASCDATPIHSYQTGGRGVTLFRRPNGAEFETSHGFVGASFRRLRSEWPCAVAFRVALDDAQRSVGEAAGASDSEDQADLLADAWIRAYKAGFLQLHVSPPRLVNRVTAHPVCSALARYQLSKTGVSTSQLQRRVRFEDSLSREVAQLLDGARDEETITQIILESIKTGQAELRQNDSGVTEPDRIASALRLQIREVLEALARQGFLIG
jgi:methyltransferase-like protein